MTRAGATCDPRPLSCFKIEPSALPLPWAFCRTQLFWKIHWSGAKALWGGWCSANLPTPFSALLFRNPRGRIAIRHNRAQTPQHRVSSPPRCTGATQPAELAQTASQFETGAFASWSCGSECELSLLAENNPAKNLLSAFKSSELFEDARLGHNGLSMITAW